MPTMIVRYNHSRVAGAKAPKHRSADPVMLGAWLILALVAGVIVGVVGLAPVHGTASVAPPAGVAGAQEGGVFSLTLVITVNNQWNSTVTGPRYWVLTPQGLVSSANISLPAHTLIRLTIVDLDSASPLPAQFAQVTGTKGNVVYMVNSTLASGGNVSLSTARAVSSFNPETQVGHTFTIAQLGINIPSAANSVELAQLYFNQTGTFRWQCMDPCGYGPSGWLGPMSSPGWMTGVITVY